MTPTHPTGSAPSGQVSYDRTGPALRIAALTVRHPDVVAEALHWATGCRAEARTPEQVAEADLTAYAEQALAVGARAISAAGTVHDSRHLDGLFDDLERRTSATTEEAAASTARLIDEATTAISRAAAETKKALVEEETRSRKAFADGVESARAQMTTQLTTLFSGESPELLQRLSPVVAAFQRELTARSESHASELFDKATRALDPDDPASLLAKHRAATERQHRALVADLDHRHEALKKSVDELLGEVREQQRAACARARLASVTPLKGGSYEDDINALMEGIASGLADEYLVTAHLGGAISGRNQKGDGVLLVEGGPARVVLEMSASKDRRGWNAYLAEAERNRLAQSSLGLVPSIELNDGHHLRVLGSRRLVLAFDPSQDDPALLRTVVQLLRLSALAASQRHDTGHVAEAQDRIADAVKALAELDTIRTAAGTIRKSADKVETTSQHVQTTVNRSLMQAQTTLAQTPVVREVPPNAGDHADGVA